MSRATGTLGKGPRVAKGTIRGVSAAAVVVALAASAATAGAVDANVIDTYDTSSAPGQVRNAFGATWVDVPKSGQLLRFAAGAENPRTTKVPGQISDFTDGFGKIWVLWRSGARSYVAAVDPRTGRVIGSPRRTRVPGTPEIIRAGARGVWTSAVGPNFRKKTTISRVNPSNRRVTNRKWPMPQQFFAEKGLLWSFTGLRLVKRAPGNLRTRGSVKAFSGFDGVTYGIGSFWTSSEGPTDNGGITKISPSSGRGPVFGYPVNVFSAGGVTTGGGKVWGMWQENSGSPWSVIGFSPAGAATSSVDVQTSGGAPNIGYGAGSVWVNDRGGNRILQITPPT